MSQSKISPFCLVALFFAVANGSGGSWNYRLAGPSHWESDFNAACGGSSQSPIDIDTSDLTYSDLSVVYGGNYSSSAVDVLVFNTGTVAEVLPLSGTFDITAPCAYDSDTTKDWELAQFHWHWGGTDVIGSEHTVDGTRYPMEMHMVHFNKDYGSLASAASNADGLLVLGFFFETSSTTNSAFQGVVDSLPSIQYEGENITEVGFDVYGLIETAAAGHFYYYPGSLTTPGCGEVVTWIVHQTPITISEAQMDEFRQLYYSGTSGAQPMLMVDNFRPTQAVGSRTVYTTDSSQESAAWVVRAEITAVITLIIGALLPLY